MATFNELDPASSGYTLVLDEGWTSPTAATIDWGNTLAPGFNWYLTRPFGWGPTLPSELSYDPNARAPGQGVLTINPSVNVAGWQLATAAVTPAGKVVGTTWGPGRGWYFEVSIAFDDALARLYGGPAAWMEPIEHMTGRDQWEGQPHGYSHFSEVDIFEYQYFKPLGNGSFGSARHDWYGPKAPYIDAGYNGYMGIVPNPPPVWTSWNKISALYIPGCPNGGTPGSIQVWFNNVPYQYTNGLGTTVPFTWIGNGNSKPPIAQGPGNFAFSQIDHDSYVIILGTGKGCPAKFGYVKMWSAP